MVFARFPTEIAAHRSSMKYFLHVYVVSGTFPLFVAVLSVLRPL